MFYKYFKGLDGLRFIAAMAVLIHHAELIKGDLGFSNLWRNHFFEDLGPIGVTFFFVLSGFLITYLLLKEKTITSTISLKNFYLRRALRILPLYYFITLLSFLILPMFAFFWQPFFSERLPHEFFLKLTMYLLLLPQVVFILFPSAPIPYGVVAWSIGVEEQFYLIWPLIIKWLKNLWGIFIAIFVIFSIFPILLIMVKHRYPTLHIGFFIDYLHTLRFSCMALGGVLALALIKNNVFILNFSYNKYVQFTSYFLLFLLLGFGYPFSVFKHEIYSIIFGIIIINVATNNEKGINKCLSYIIDSRLFIFMGARSYGVYMYHMIGIQIAIKLSMFVFGKSEMDALSNIFFYCFAILFTFIISILSYKWFERPILDLRNSHSNRIKIIQ